MTIQTCENGTQVVFDCRPSPAQDFDVVEEIWAARTYQWGPNDVADRVVLDLGANIGAFALWAMAAGARRVIAVEPDPDNLAALNRNLALNRNFAAHVDVIEGAAGPADRYLVERRVSGAGTWVEIPDERRPNRVACYVDGWSIKALLDLAGTEMLVMKCDIEGGEYALFADAVEADLRRIDKLVLEFHRPDVSGGLGEGFRSLGEANPFGSLVTTLAQFHEVRTHGMPTRGGLIFANRY